MRGGIDKDIMKIMREKQVSSKSEIIKEISNKRKVSKKEIDKTLDRLIENKWLISLYGSNTTVAITQKGLKQSKAR